MNTRPTMIDKLSEIDFILMQLEDVAHGEEGKKITHARKLLAEFVGSGGLERDNRELKMVLIMLLRSFEKVEKTKAQQKTYDSAKAISNKHFKVTDVLR